MRRFEQEARAVAALNHPNTVSVHDVGNAVGVHYIISELLEGETLRDRITTAKPLSSRCNWRMALPLLTIKASFIVT